MIIQKFEFSRKLGSLFLAATLGFGASQIAIGSELPDDESKEEITSQLLELAVANIDPIFANQYDSLVSSASTDSYSEQLKMSYLLIKDFREYYRQLEWQNKQQLNLKYQPRQFDQNDEALYDDLVKFGNLNRSVINMRPLVAEYLDYRKNIKELLQNSQRNLPKYTFTVIKKNACGNSVKTISEVLKIKGYLPEDSLEYQCYGYELEEAIKKFQSDNGLQPDGVVGKMTYEFLYKNDDEKAVQLARALLRLSEPMLNIENGTYIWVNLPQFEIVYFENGVEVLRSKSVIGKPKTKTPLLMSRIDNVVLNPTWTVPASIKKTDYLPKLREDPLYLEKRGINMIDPGKGRVNPSEMDPEEFQQRVASYSFVQNPGTSNALGLYKFNFKNSFSVYLHSTSSPSAFNRADRALSHGCVRVQKSKELAEMLLKNIKTPEQIANIISSRRTSWLKVDEMPYVFIIYTTAFIDGEHHVHYYPDVYLYDKGTVPLSSSITKHFYE